MICKKCGLEKDIFLFEKRGDKKGCGYRHICKKCFSIERKEYRKREYVKNKATKYRKKIYSKNKEKSKQHTYKWRKINKERYLEIAKVNRDKTRSTLDGKLKHSLSSQILQSIKEKKDGRSWEKLLGYSLIELKNRLKSLFEDWMTWENYGGNARDKKNRTWWIDHIKPISSFDFKDGSQIIECWSLKNLRPLEKIQNIKKGNKEIK
jgi:hypothetical protein